MKKFLLPGILALVAFLLPSRSQAVPLDVPYQILVTTVNANGVVLSTTNFPSGSSGINANVASSQWCVDHVIVSAPSAYTFTMAWSTSTLTASTTDYVVSFSTGGVYDCTWSYRDPYCAPQQEPILNIKSNVSGSTITVQGYLWKGWN